jgi:hypothetical protein
MNMGLVLNPKNNYVTPIYFAETFQTRNNRNENQAWIT